MAEWADSSSCSTAWAGRKRAWFFKKAAGAENSDNELGPPEDERCTGVFQERWFLHESCLPVAIPFRGSHKNQLRYPDSSRLVCW